MPRKKLPKRVSEKNLVGLWFRCKQGHLTDNPIYLGNVIYCPNEECTAAAEVVHTPSDDKKVVTPRDWNAVTTQQLPSW